MSPGTPRDSPTPIGPVAACIKWVDLRPDVDPLHGSVTPSERGWGFSPADLCAVEVALRLAATWGCEAIVVCAGPPEADRTLVEVAASGAAKIIRLDQSSNLRSEDVAEVLASLVHSGDVDARAVVCGDLSYDRGSGTVPALLAHHLGWAQALGLIEITPTADGTVTATRRLDGARRELLALDGPTVFSVEGGVATLRRAPLGASVGSRDSGPVLEVRPGRIEGHVEPPRTRPWRPRARVLAAPEGEHALDRILALTGAAVDASPLRSIEATPDEAAELIVDQLRTWGYLAGDAASPGDG